MTDTFTPVIDIVFADRVSRPCWQWAEEFRTIADGESGLPGPKSYDNTPYMREIVESFDDPSVSVTVMMIASRVGKTDGAIDFIGQTICEKPKFVLMLYPTIESAKKFRKKQINPMIRDAPEAFSGKVNIVARNSDNEMMSLNFLGGNLSMIGSNSPSGFRQVQAEVVIGDEIDAMEVGDEGDPIRLLMRRADNHPRAVKILMSTPTIRGKSRIESWYEKGDQRRWWVPSPYCDQWHVMHWDNVKWPEGEPEKAAYHDPFTGDPWTESQRHEMVRRGEWRADKPDEKLVRSYHASGLVSLFPPNKGYVSKPHQWAVEYLEAQAESRAAVQTWTNTFLAETVDEEAGLEVNHELIIERCELYSEDENGQVYIPERALFLTCGIDVQGNRMEASVHAWGPDFEQWFVEYRVIETSLDDPECASKLHKFLSRNWKHESGATISIEKTSIDAGWRPDDVTRLASQLINMGIPVMCVHGAGGVKSKGYRPLMPRVPSRNNRQHYPIWTLGTDAGKEYIHHKVMLEDGSGRWHFPSNTQCGCDEQFFKELFSERCIWVTNKRTGARHKEFRRNTKLRNEPLDCAVYALAAAKSEFRDWDQLAARLSSQDGAEKKEKSTFFSNPRLRPSRIRY